MNTLAEKEQRLKLIKELILEDEKCFDMAKQANQLVFGDGDFTSEIVFIGEAPGKKEDETGLPFVGSAGKFLDTMLEVINLDRKKVYITNIVKYRPLNNRDPLPEEIKIFLPYLQMELEVIQPKVVVALGRHSASCFVPNIKISEEHGKPKRMVINFNENKLEIILLPLYHPAAALYNGSKRQILIDDFTIIPEIISRKKMNNINNLTKEKLERIEIN